jgi:hypothetical protein
VKGASYKALHAILISLPNGKLFMVGSTRDGQLVVIILVPNAETRNRPKAGHFELTVTVTEIQDF